MNFQNYKREFDLDYRDNTMKYKAINRAHNISKINRQAGQYEIQQVHTASDYSPQTANSIYFDWLAIRSVTGFGMNHFKHP